VAGQDYTMMFALTPALNSFKIIMAIRMQWNMSTRQIDWKGAYLNAMIDQEVYMHQPPGMEVPGEETPVCQLNRAMYGMLCCSSQHANEYTTSRNSSLGL